VDDALVVRRGEAARYLGRVLDGLPGRQRAGGQPPPQGLSLEELHDGIRRALVLAEVVDRQDVRVGEGGHGLRFPLEAGEPARVARESLGQDLHRDAAAEAGVAGPVDLAHPARAEWRFDLVVPETRARRQCHDGS